MSTEFAAPERVVPGEISLLNVLIGGWFGWSRGAPSVSLIFVHSLSREQGLSETGGRNTMGACQTGPAIRGVPVT